MDIEIGYDVSTAGMAQGTTFNPEDHQMIGDSLWLREVKKLTQMDDLFVYRHRVHGTYMLSGWLMKPNQLGPGVMCEVESMSDHPDSAPPDRPTIEYLRMRFRRRNRDKEKRALGAFLRRSEKQRMAEEKRVGDDMVAEMVDTLAPWGQSMVSVPAMPGE